MDDQTPDLPPDIRGLLEAERGDVPPAPRGARRRVLGRVAATVGLSIAAVPLASATGSSGAAAASSVLAKWVGGGLAALALAGGGAYVGLHASRRPAQRQHSVPAWTAAVPADPTAAEPAHPEVAAPEPAVPPPAAVVPVVPVVPVPGAPVIATRSAARARPAGNAPGGDLAAERALLDDARAALARGDGAAALATTRAHGRRYPVGLLAEERENIAIRALLAVGRTAEAHARAAAFRARFPGSLSAPAVEAVLRSTTPSAPAR